MTKVVDDIYFDAVMAEHSRAVQVEEQRDTILRIVDFLGVVRAGARILNDRDRGNFGNFSMIPGDSEIWVSSGTGSPEDAAFWNAWAAHATELDDGDRFGAVHPGAPVVAAVLAIVQDEQLTLKDLLRGVRVGYLGTVWLARSLQPHLRDHGYHASGTCGVIGAALGVSSARMASPEQFRSSLNFAVASSSGMLDVFSGESEMKPFNVAQASLSGVRAATLGTLGFAGPPRLLSGKNGFLAHMSGGNIVDTLSDPPIGVVSAVYTKHYAPCRHCHGPVEAAIDIRERIRDRLHAVQSIQVITHDRAKSRHDHQKIDGPSSAKQSIPYCTAVALLKGLSGLDAFEERVLSDERVLELTSLTEVTATPEITALAPTKRVAIVQVQMEDGSEETCRVDYPKGEPENPLTENELVHKYVSLSEYGGIPKLKAMEHLTKLISQSDSELRFLGER